MLEREMKTRSEISPELTSSFTVGRVYSLGGTSSDAQIRGDGNRLEADENGAHYTPQAENWSPLVMLASLILTSSTKVVVHSPIVHCHE
jgi:hypothetical protein